METIDDLWRFCGIVVKTTFCPKGFTPETCLVAIQFGMEVGLTPMQALQNVAVISGKPALFGDAPLALCRTHQDWQPGAFKEWTEGEGEDMVAYCQVGRRGEELITQSFSWQDAKRAGLTGSDTYRKYPQRMLMFRARGWALRDMYGDKLKGLWSEHEARDQGESQGTTRVALGGKEAFLDAPTIDVTPPKVEPQAGGDWTADKIEKAKPGRPRRMVKDLKQAKPPATAEAQDDARQVRQEAAAAEKAEPKDRELIVRLRSYPPRLKAEGIAWKDVVKVDPHKLTDDELERLMHRLEGIITDAAFEHQMRDDEGTVGREPGADDT
jgi:hypothetical protein